MKKKSLQEFFQEFHQKILQESLRNVFRNSFTNSTSIFMCKFFMDFGGHWKKNFRNSFTDFTRNRSRYSSSYFSLRLLSEFFLRCLIIFCFSYQKGFLRSSFRYLLWHSSGIHPQGKLHKLFQKLFSGISQENSLKFLLKFSKVITSRLKKKDFSREFL